MPSLDLLPPRAPGQWAYHLGSQRARPSWLDEGLDIRYPGRSHRDTQWKKSLGSGERVPTIVVCEFLHRISPCQNTLSHSYVPPSCALGTPNGRSVKQNYLRESRKTVSRRLAHGSSSLARSSVAALLGSLSCILPRPDDLALAVVLRCLWRGPTIPVSLSLPRASRWDVGLGGVSVALDPRSGRAVPIRISYIHI